MKTLSTIVGFIVLFALIIFVCTVVDGWVLTKLWGWFIVPTFGLPPLSIAVAVGLALVVHFLTYQSDAKRAEKRKGWELFGHMLAYAILRPAITLLFGWIVHLFC